MGGPTAPRPYPLMAPLPTCTSPLISLGPLYTIISGDISPIIISLSPKKFSRSGEGVSQPSEARPAGLS